MKNLSLTIFVLFSLAFSVSYQTQSHSSLQLNKKKKKKAKAKKESKARSGPTSLEDSNIIPFVREKQAYIREQLVKIDPNRKFFYNETISLVNNLLSSTNFHHNTEARNIPELEVEFQNSDRLARIEVNINIPEGGFNTGSTNDDCNTNTFNYNFIDFIILVDGKPCGIFLHYNFNMYQSNQGDSYMKMGKFPINLSCSMFNIAPRSHKVSLAYKSQCQFVIGNNNVLSTYNLRNNGLYIDQHIETGVNINIEGDYLKYNDFNPEEKVEEAKEKK